MPASPEMSSSPDGKSIDASPERRETEHEPGALTVYLMRHGESETDKSKPNRGLTELGREQVRVNFHGIINQLITDDDPTFSAWDDTDSRADAAQKALASVELHLRDSGTDRTIEQEWVEHEMLVSLGVPPESINLPRSAYAWKGEEPPASAGPGVQKRVKGVGGIDYQPDFRKRIGDPAYQASLGAENEIIAWALTPEDVIPEGVENRRQMSERKNADLDRVEHLAERLAEHGRTKRPVVIANSHESIITLTASDELGIPIEELGGIPNAEGLRMDFYGDGRHRFVTPFGSELTERIDARRQPTETDEE